MMASAYAPCSLSIGFLLLTLSAMAANFLKDVDIVWGDGRSKIADNGELLTLSLDRISGSGFRSKNQYLYCRIDLQIKLVAGNSAGTVTAYYLSSEGEAHDEIDFEFLGNLSGDPYIVHTNVYTQGKGNREMQFYLWFDPTVDFHTYSLLWNPVHILFYVDGTPIREFKKLQESRGVAYPESQAMRLYSSLWDADEWATRGGLVKTDWGQAPFMASFLNLNADGCVRSSSSSSSSCGFKAWMNQELDTEGVKRMNWVQKNYMVYNYCSDVKRFPQGLPPECFATL